MSLKYFDWETYARKLERNASKYGLLVDSFYRGYKKYKQAKKQGIKNSEMLRLLVVLDEIGSALERIQKRKIPELKEIKKVLNERR